MSWRLYDFDKQCLMIQGFNVKTPDFYDRVECGEGRGFDVKTPDFYDRVEWGDLLYTGKNYVKTDFWV